MNRFMIVIIFALTVAAAPLSAESASQDRAPAGNQRPDASAIAVLKAQVEALRAEYEKRIKQLESQVEEMQAQLLRAAPEPEAPAQVRAAERAPEIPGALNPAIAVVGNLVARADDRKVFSESGTRLDNRFNFREAEVDFRVPVDPYADAVVIAAFGAESSGNFSADIEEGYVNIKKLPFAGNMPLGLKLKAGRFRPAFGKSNLLHTHDLPQTVRPLPVEEFLGEEGFIQDGLSGSFFIPTPWDKKSSLDVSLQAVTGGAIALSPNPDSRVSYVSHLRWYRSLTDKNDLELGWSSYLRPSGNGTSSVNLQGFDFTYRWKPLRQGQWKSCLLGSEVFLARHPNPENESAGNITPASLSQAATGKPAGFTLFSQWQFDRRKYAGVRFDRTDAVAFPGLKRNSVTPYFSYYFSEFLRFRLNFEHRWSNATTEERRNTVFAELNFVFGAHPPEPFWVNK